MAVTGDTGNGTTVAFSSTTVSGHIFQQLGSGGAAVRGMVDASSLATTGDEERIPMDYNTNEPVTGTLIFVQSGALPALGTVETMTITYPKLVATNTAANLAGTGIISRIGKPQAINNTLMTLDYAWEWDGDTGPTFTAES